jgi:hypothetical protein
MIVLDWPTIILLVIVNGAVDVGAVAWVSGYWSKKKIERWLTSPESQPYIDRIVKQVKIPEVPSLDEIATEVTARAPDISDKLALMEERMGGKLTAEMNTKWAGLQEQLSLRMGQVIQANLASFKAKVAASNAGLDDLGIENDGSMSAEVLGLLLDEDSAKKGAKLIKMFKRGQQQGGFSRSLMGGGAGQQGGFQMGQILTNDRGTWVLSQSGWQMLQPAAPAPAPAPVVVPAPASIKPSEMPPELPPELEKAK